MIDRHFILYYHKYNSEKNEDGDSKLFGKVTVSRREWESGTE